MARILFAASGSIGHIAPCVAVWRAVQNDDPTAEAHFVCSTQKQDGEFLTKERVTFFALSERALPLWKIPFITIRAWRLLGEWKPDVIFSKGGGVTIPIAIAARIRGIPIIVHESDAVPGRATRCIARLGATVCYGFPNIIADCGLRIADIHNSQFVIRNPVTGNPVRPTIASGSHERGLALTGLNGGKPILLVIGGSQGAQALNRVVASQIDELLQHVQIIHVTGEGKLAAPGGRSGYWSTAFAHEELPDLYAIADIALSRSGAGSISELAANGIPVVLVPLEGVAHDHQIANANVVVQSGGCVMLAQEFLGDRLVEEVRRIAGNSGLRKTMAEKMRSMSSPHAAAELSKILLAHSRKSGRVS